MKSNIVTKVNSLNYLHEVRLYTREIKKGYSLHVDFSRWGKRYRRKLDLYLYGDKAHKNKDEETLRIAVAKRDKIEKEISNPNTRSAKRNKKLNQNFVEYYGELIQTGIKTHHSWISTYKYLKSYSKNIAVKDVDQRFCEGFKDYILKKVSQNTAKTYYAKLSTALNELVKDGVIPFNPARHITIKEEEVVMPYLTINEVQKLFETHEDDIETKNAFLFSCLTGLRFSDMKSLSFDDIEEEHLIFKTHKTGDVNRIKLSKDALKIYERQQNVHQSGLVFDMKCNPRTNKVIDRWVKKAGIKKYITFHSARHTFATMLLTQGIGIYTVSKLLGHKDIKNTLRYAKLIDPAKDQAIEKLPEFSI